MKILDNISNLFSQNKNNSDKEDTIPENLRSKELEWKLALLVRNMDDV